jgi:hypothetical protein
MPPTRSTLLIPAVILVAMMTLPAAEERPPGFDPKVMELMKPGPEHQQLAKLAGTWDVSCRMWMKPDAPALESKAVAVATTLFDGRFVQSEFKGAFMGQPFTGVSTMGYDRPAKHYASTWCDSMGTGITYLTGTSSDGGKTITYLGDMVCPEDGKSSLIRQVETHQSDDRFTLVMYQTKDGKESKTMELAYTRRN